MSDTAVLVHTVRGGKDPDDHWCLITSELADLLPDEDIWRDLGQHIDHDDPGVLVSFGTEDDCRAFASSNGYEIEPDVWEAVGY